MKVSKLIARSLGTKEVEGSSEQLFGVSLFRLLGFTLKISITIAALLFIYHRFMAAERQLSVVGSLTSITFHWSYVWLGMGAALCAAVNWSMEVVKWRILVNTQFPLSWKRAAKGVLSGITFGLFTPNRVGEFFGRVLTLKEGQRIKGTLLSMVNGLAQTVATLTFGVCGLVLLLWSFAPQAIGWIPTVIIQATVGLTLVFALLIYFRMELFSDLLLRIKPLQKYREHIVVLRAVPERLLLHLYGLSLIRFTTFIAQYLIVFQLVIPGGNLAEILSASILTLFSITLLPFVPVPDLLLRESFALGYFELYQFEPVGVSLVVFLVWGINIALPAILGAVTLFTFRIFKTR